MRKVIDNLATAPLGGRNASLNGAAWTLGKWIAAGALEQGEVEDELYAAAERNGLVADDGQRQCWATIRSGLGKGLLEPIELDAEHQLDSPRSVGARELTMPMSCTEQSIAYDGGRFEPHP